MDELYRSQIKTPKLKICVKWRYEVAAAQESIEREQKYRGRKITGRTSRFLLHTATFMVMWSTLPEKCIRDLPHWRSRLG